MAATYLEPWVEDRDELRCLFRDNETEEGDTDVLDAILSDEVYDQVIEDKGLVPGAIFLATTYAAHFVREVAKYKGAKDGTTAAWLDRAKEYRAIADDLRSGAIIVGAGMSAGWYVTRAPMTAGLCDGERLQITGVWPLDVPPPGAFLEGTAESCGLLDC